MRRHVPASRHSPAEDLHALALGSSLAAFGLVLLNTAGLVTGGVAGMALIFAHRTGIGVGALFVAVNLPFFLLAGRRMGRAFTIKSLATMIALATLATTMPGWMRLSGAQPAFAALFGGSLIGLGMLLPARHHASVGGVSIFALYLQERRGWSAGLIQLAVDAMVIAASAVVIDVRSASYSVLSAFAQNLIVFIHHRPGRYAAA